MNSRKNFLRRFWAIVIAIFVMTSIVFGGIKSYAYESPKTVEPAFTQEQADSTLRAWQAAADSAAKADAVIKLVDKHIKSIAPKAKVSAEALVTTSAKYDIDIRLTLAQAQAESHFGTTGVARKTNSVFNVNSCDGWSASYIKRKGLGYRNPDHSVEPWAKLIKSKYLVNGKTEKQLIRNFVTKGGARYATSKQYEARLQHIYYNIPKEITISYNEYKKYVKNCM